LRSHDPLALVPEPRRYPLAFAACWIAGCSVVATVTGPTLRVEPFYLPAILLVAWYYGPRHGLAAALGATLAASAADLAAATHAASGIGVLSWNLAARGLLFALPAWLLCLVREQQRRLACLVKIDAASGFATQHGLIGTLADELVRTERLGGETSIVCIGVSGLPRLASERGREHVEALLRGFCATLGACVRRADVVARLAEDEFALLLRGTGSEAAAGVADKLSRSLTNWLLTQGNDLSCSVGFTTAPRGRLLDATALLARAVANMYEQRSAGPAQQPTGSAARVPALRGVTARESA
jgi:diguanylate cyclase (GGDEF)-like protein